MEQGEDETKVDQRNRARERKRNNYQSHCEGSGENGRVSEGRAGAGICWMRKNMRFGGRGKKRGRVKYGRSERCSTTS